MSRLALFAYGFRPFFLLAGLWAVVPMATVAWFLHRGSWPSSDVSLLAWHGHEMIFGFAAAAICGFLTTAVPSWTGTTAVSGLPLASLVVLWILGRIGALPFSDSPNLLIALLSIAFLPALTAVVGAPLMRERNFRNLPCLVFLAALFIADLVYQAPRFGWIERSPFDAPRLAVNTVLLMVLIVGGRIIPAFTRNGLRTMGRSADIKNGPLIDLGAILSGVAVLLGDLLAEGTALSGALAGLAASLLAIRLSGWSGQRTLEIPLLWVLHLGYCWLIIGLALKAVWLLAGFGWAMNWMHAITTGAFGTMILGVTTRAALGHTGRALAAPKPIVVSYLLVSLAATLRVWGPWLAPNYYWQALTLAIAAWIGAYLIFLWLFTPILVSPRADGQPG